VISVTERQAYIGRVRALAKLCADAFVQTEAGIFLLARSGSGEATCLPLSERDIADGDRPRRGRLPGDGRAYAWHQLPRTRNTRTEDRTMPDLLIELFSEEIPARMQAKAAADLKRLMTDGLVEAGLTYAMPAPLPRRAAWR
jgi:hypothetical protein